MVKGGALLIAVAVLALAACSSDSDDDTEPSLEERGASALESAISEGAEPVETDLPHPCDRVTTAEIADLVGAKVSVTRTPQSGTSVTMTCAFTATDLDSASVTLQTTVDGGSLRDFVALFTATGSKAYDAKVPGADEAVVLVDDDPDYPSATAAAEQDGAIVGAIVVGGPEDELTATATRALGLMLD